jgi:hypothetical protein
MIADALQIHTEQCFHDITSDIHHPDVTSTDNLPKRNTGTFYSSETMSHYKGKSEPEYG